MIHPDTELRFISEDVGLGVVATRLIPMGTITWVLDELDQCLSPERVASLNPDFTRILDRYGYPDLRGNTILCWDHGRFVNHSCDPTCVSGEREEFEVAVRDILPGEQLTDDYGEYISEDSFDCACGSVTCRGRVEMPIPPMRLESRRDRVARALARVATVKQPLGCLMVRPLQFGM